MIIIYGYKKCSTVQKALKFLKKNKIDFEHIDNVENKITEQEIKKIFQASGEEIKKLFNTSGIKYRELNLKEKLLTMSLEEKINLLATDGMLVKRPIFIEKDQNQEIKKILIGFKESKWEEIIL